MGPSAGIGSRCTGAGECTVSGLGLPQPTNPIVVLVSCFLIIHHTLAKHSKSSSVVCGRVDHRALLLQMVAERDAANKSSCCFQSCRRVNLEVAGVWAHAPRHQSVGIRLDVFWEVSKKFELPQPIMLRAPCRWRVSLRGLSGRT